jgi:hypothetical protein
VIQFFALRHCSQCAQRSALGVMPSKDWSDIMSAFMKVVPSPGLKLATICGCGSGANENAFKLAFIHKATQARAAKGLKPIEVEDADKLSCMSNNLPGASSLLRAELR